MQEAEARTLTPSTLYPELVRAFSIFVVALLYLLLFHRESNYIDDASYFGYAHSLLTEESIRSSNANFYRFGFILPAAFVQFFFGYTALSYYIVSYFFSAALIASTYLCTRLYAGRVLSILSALVIATSPYFLQYATILRIDIPALFWFSSALILLTLAVQSSSHNRTRFITGALAGATMALTLWTKEGMLPAVFALALYPFFLKWDSLSFKCALTAFFSACVVGVAELFTNWYLFSDPLKRVSTILGGHVSGSKGKWIEMGLVADNLDWTDLALRYYYLFSESAYGILFLLLAGATFVLAFFIRQRKIHFLLFAAVLTWAFVSLYPSSTDPLVPLLRTKERYFLPVYYIIILFFFASLSSLLASLKERGPLRATYLAIPAFGLTALLIYNGFRGEYGAWYYSRNGANAMSQTQTLIEKLSFSPEPLPPLRNIYSGLRTLRILKAYVAPEFQSRLKQLDYVSGAYIELAQEHDYHPGDLLVLNMSRLRNNAKYMYTEALPTFLESPPPNWLLLSETKWRAFRIYYVVEPSQSVDEDSDKSLQYHFSLYPYRRQDDVKIVKQEEALSSYSFTETTDLRMVTGHGKYNKPPSTRDDYLYMKEKGLLSFSLKLTIGASVKLQDAYFVLYPDGSTPTISQLTIYSDATNKIEINGLKLFGDEHSFPAPFRLMLKMSGEGSVNVEAFRISRKAYSPILDKTSSD